METTTKGAAKAAKQVPAHIANLSKIVLNNENIRTLTSIGIIREMREECLIPQKKAYVRFGIYKWSVVVDGLKTEYKYTHNIFIKNFLASFNVFSDYALVTLQQYCSKERSQVNIGQDDLDEATARLQSVITSSGKTETAGEDVDEKADDTKEDVEVKEKGENNE